MQGNLGLFIEMFKKERQDIRLLFGDHEKSVLLFLIVFGQGQLRNDNGMNKPGTKAAPSAKDFKESAKTAKKK